MKKQINWDIIYDRALSKISSDYIKAKSYKQTPDFEMVKQDKDMFLEVVKSNFFQRLDTSVYDAFYNLGKFHLPLLAEQLILESFENKLLNKNEFSKIFIAIYANAKKDCTLFSNQISSDKLLEIFRYCNKTYVVNKRDKEYFKNLPNEINIYRGTAGKTEDIAKSGISWTLDYKIAREFAEYNKVFYKTKFHHISEGTILKENVILYIHYSARHEHEIIINPRDIYNHKFNELPLFISNP